MKEDLVKELFAEYLSRLYNKPVKIKPKSASGPDFIIEGHAYECKGSEVDEKILFSQILSYGLQYSQMSLVIPCDVLNFTFIWKLEALEKFLRDHPNQVRSIAIYLIAPKQEQENNYAIFCCRSAQSLNSEISSLLYRLIPHFTSVSSIEEKEGKIKDFLNTIESKIKEEFRKVTIEKAQQANNIWQGDIISIETQTQKLSDL